MNTAILAMTLGLLTVGADMSEYAKPELLVEPADLSAGGFVVLDARPADAYSSGHAPGALPVDAAAWAKAFDQGQDVEGWQQRIGALGLTPESKVVIYDDNLTKDAARVWWILRYWGFEDVRLLNGGWKGWQSASGEIETKANAPAASTAPELKPLADRLATKEQILASLDAKDLQIVDTRSAAEHCGDEKLRNPRGGAIPGAKHLEWDDLLDPETGRFLPAPVLADVFAKSGVELDRPTATHCQSGGRASVMAFGMELMGAKNVSNYHRSWHEWSHAPETPVVTPEKKPE
jgi:thiosulfate/3-mercaptopyruvate sulfurtransferase